jgi:putative protease
MLVPALSSAKRGVLLGRVRQVSGNRVTVELRASIKRGDGVVFAGNRADSTAENAEQGGRVYEVFRGRESLTEPIDAGQVQLTFAHGAIDFARLFEGQQIWKTDDPELAARLRKSFEGEKPKRCVPVDLRISAAVGAKLVVEAQTDGGASCRLESEEPLVEARKHPATLEVLREQFDRLGGTNYELRGCEATIEGGPMIPLSVLGKLRHELVRRLDEAASRPPQRRLAEHSPLAAARARLAEIPREAAPGNPCLHVLCRSLAQLEAVLACEVGSVMVDFQDIREYRDAVARAHAAEATILVATPRIQKPDEMGILRVLGRHGADGILVRNLAGLEFYTAAGLPVVADFSLNATNEMTAEYLREKGARRVTASYDLNRDQLLDLVSAVPPQWLEVVIHQHMPMFHMEHCVFCAVLSPGTNKHNCGRPCDVHQVRLRDRVGMEHTLTADVGCRNTLFNAVPQSAAEAVPELIRRGLRNFRVELLHDAPQAEIAKVIDLYRRLLAGTIRGKDVYGTLQAANRVGVTRGTLEERRNPLAIL